MIVDSIVVMANIEYFSWQGCSFARCVDTKSVHLAVKEKLLSCKRSSSVRASYLICYVRPCCLSIHFVRAFYHYFKFVNFQGLSGPK